MEYILKVSPKGQVTFPKKLRDALAVKDRITVEVKDREAIVRKAEAVNNDLAGCFHDYFRKQAIPVEDAMEKAREIVAHERAQKNP